MQKKNFARLLPAPYTYGGTTSSPAPHPRTSYYVGTPAGIARTTIFDSGRTGGMDTIILSLLFHDAHDLGSNGVDYVMLCYVML
jgi:hypothetical protein